MALVLVWTVLGGGCKKFVEIPPPKDQIVSQTAFADDATAIATLNGIYSKMMGSSAFPTASSITLYTGMSSDELAYYTTSNRDEFMQDQITRANNLTIESYFWNPFYALAYQANSCIEGAEKSVSISAATKDMVIGEALFVRAFINFYLANIFGKVPLVTTTDYRITKDLGQSMPNEVYKQITTDLLRAINLLKDDYPSAGRVRPNKAAAQALLARVYLYLKDYTAADQMAGSVIDNSKYQIVEDLNNVFLANSGEAIWQLAPVTPNYNTWDASFFLPASTSAAPTYIVLQNLVSDFEPGDKRLGNWIKSRVYNGATIYYPFKYKVGKGVTAVTEYNMAIRLAELYLIRSEARTMNNNLESAVRDLNVIRKRAGLDPLSLSIGKSDLTKAIEHERRIELCFEWGHRWLDLKRTGRIDDVIGAIKPTWKSYAAWYPIPYAQILINTKLIQNEGY